MMFGALLTRCISLNEFVHRALNMLSAQTSKHCLNVAVVLLVICSAVLLNVLYSAAQNFIKLHNEQSAAENKTHRSDAVWPTGFYPHNTYGFHPVNEHGVYSFWNVCIEALGRPNIEQMDFMGNKIYFNETAKIIVYNSFYRNGVQRLHVSGSHNSAWNHWEVTFRRGRIPATHVFHNTTAFFVTQTCPANLHHFWIDMFVPLFGTIRRANKLRAGSDNRILYRRPTDQPGSDIAGCYNKSTFEDIVRTLYIHPVHDVFFRAPVNECYSSGVFGSHPFINDPRSVVNHVLAQIYPNAIKEHNDRTTQYFITFVQRRYRRIINIRELLHAAHWIGFGKLRIVNFEKHSIGEQVRIAASSCLMVGVQGAGLQWSVFMPRGCTLIEIAWPSQHWGFHFRTYVEPYGVTYYPLRAINARVNWPAYELHLRNSTPVPLDERLKLLNDPPRSPSLDNIWKFADVFVNKESFLEIIRDIGDLTPRETLPPPTPETFSENTTPYPHV